MMIAPRFAVSVANTRCPLSRAIPRRSMSARGERGTVTLFTILALAFLLAMGGIAIDLAHLTAVRNELQRSMDAAALAGAGGLGFGDYAFSAARDAAQVYAGKPENGYRGGTNGIISLNLNAGNDAVPPITPPGGYITLGTFSGGTFTASSNGSVVNAVKCHYESTIPASFLRILGFSTLPVSAEAIAVASPPRRPGPGTCIFPVGVSKCAFQTDPSDPLQGFNSSNGCGKVVRFFATGTIAGTPLTAAWVNLHGPTPPVPATLNTDITASSGNGCTLDLAVSNPLGASGDDFPGPAGTILGELLSRFTPSVDVTGTTGVVVRAGWRVVVPVIDTPCPEPSRPTTETYPIIGWTNLVVTAFDDQGDVYPDAGALPPGFSPTPGKGIVYGYISCERFPTEYNPNPAPISALSRRLHLVR